MQLRGQGNGARGGERGYAMAALLVGMSVMAVLMGAALPVWNKQAQREREEEYLFRAREYAKGIQKFQRKAGPGTAPPTIDFLVEQRFVRRKYKDPLTGQDFQPVYQTAAPITGSGGAAGQVGVNGPGASGTSTMSGSGGFGTTATSQSGGTATQSQGGSMPGAPIIGVVSKSKGTSIKVYNGRTRYDQWAVTVQDVKPGKGLPPDILQALNMTNQQQGGAGAGQPVGGGSGGNPFGGGMTGSPGNPFGQPGTNPFAAPGRAPAGGAGANPFGQPVNPFGQAQPPTGNPFGAPGTNPFQSGTGGAAPPFTPMYPAPAGANPFQPPPRK